MTIRTPGRRRQVLALVLLLGWRHEARAQLALPYLAAVDLPAGARALDVAVSPLRAYVLAKGRRGTSALYVLDTTVPSAPVVVGTLSLDRRASRLVASRGAEGARLYVGTRGSPSEVLVVDVPDAAAPTLGSAVPIGRAVSALVMRGDRVYVGTRNDSRAGGRELRVLDVSAPDEPAELSSIEIGAHVNDLALVDGTLVAATSDDAREVVLFDTSNEGAPVEASAIDLPGRYDAVAVALQPSGTLAVVTDGGVPDFRLFDLAGASPIPRGTASLRTRGARVALRGEWAWITSRRSDGLRLLDLSHFSHPRVQRTYAVRGAIGLAVHGPYTYLATRDPKLDVQVVDPVLPLRPEIGDRNGDGVATVACLGDSNTDPAWWPGPTWCEQLASAAPMLLTVNEGRGGGTAVDIPDWPYDGPGQLDVALAGEAPDVVILAFGTNDIRFDYSVAEVLAAYRDLAARAEQAGAFVLIAFTPPVAPWFPGAVDLNPLYAQLNAQLAVEWPAARLVDFGTDVSPSGDYMEDGIHFSVPGHAKRALAAYTRLLFAD